MKRFQSVSVILLILALFFAACDDEDDPVGSEDISSEDVELMMEAFQNAGIMGGPFMSFAGGMPQNKTGNNVIALSDEHNENFEQDIACPEGGTATYRGSLNQGENQISSELSLSLNDCQSLDGEDNAWTFNGSLDYVMNFAGGEESFEMDGTNEGQFSFDSNMASGECEMNVSYAFSGSESEVSGQVNGTVCGEDASYGF